MIDIAIIIVSWNVRQYVDDCLRSVYADLRNSGLNGKVWVVDNKSTDGTVAYLSDLYPMTEIIENDKNLGFGRANNIGMQAASVDEPRYYFLLNPDTVVEAGAMSELLNFLDSHPKVGMAGPRLRYGSGRFQHSAFAFPGLRQLIFEFYPLPSRWYETPLNGRYPRRYYDAKRMPFAVDHTLGAAMVVRRDVAEATGGFDESFHMYCEEIDWAWRIRQAGWDIYTVPSAEIVHFGGESTRQVANQSVINLWQSRARFYRKYHSPIRMKLARRIVRAGLARKATQTDDEALRDAFSEASAAWKSK